MTQTIDMQGRVEQALVEQRIGRRIIVTCLIFFPMVAAINASSIVVEARRNGEDIDARLPWLLEFTSLVAFVPPILLMVALQRERTIISRNLLRTVGLLAGGSLAFSLLHIASMALLRAVFVPILTGEPYVLLPEPARDLLYEFRKDLFPFAVIVALSLSSRRIEEGRLETEAARSLARKSGQLTLKCGGRTLYLDAQTIVWARAAGNYVELRAGRRDYLARITLTAVETLAAEAGLDMVRIHRSHIVNRAMIRATIPSGDGGVVVRLEDGSELRASRRNRGSLNG